MKPTLLKEPVKPTGENAGKKLGVAEMITTIEELMADELPEYECPGCGTERVLELDARGWIVCECCGGQFFVEGVI